MNLNREQTHAAIAPEQSEVFSHALILTVLAKLSEDVMLRLAVRNDEFSVALDLQVALQLELCLLSACWNSGLCAKEVRVACPGQIDFGAVGCRFKLSWQKRLKARWAWYTFYSAGGYRRCSVFSGGLGPVQFACRAGGYHRISVSREYFKKFKFF